MIWETNFDGAPDCQGFAISQEICEGIAKSAEKRGDFYGWQPLFVDYFLKEKNDFDYETRCQLVNVLPAFNSNGSLIHGSVDAIPVGEMPYIRVFSKSQKVRSDLIIFAKVLTYLRFWLRDNDRRDDIKSQKNFLKKFIVSQDTHFIFSEDKTVSQDWATCIFPDNINLASAGKIGEFIFAYWACSHQIVVSNVDVVPRGEADEYDFIHSMCAVGDKSKLKIDVKTFIYEREETRNWWNISETCLSGSHKQDIFVFVIVDEIFFLGKVVGYLTADEVLKWGVRHSGKYGGKGYYRVTLDKIHNTYYLRALLDTWEMFFDGLLCEGYTKALENRIKEYPIDEIDKFLHDESPYDWLPDRFYGLVKKPSTTMFLNPKFGRQTIDGEKW